MSPISGLSNGYLPSLLSSLAAQSAGSVNLAISTTSVSATISFRSQDSAQLSPLAQFVAQLQNIQESNPTEYPSVLSQIASNMKTAADTATQSGDSYAASEYNTLVKDFTEAAKSGDLPNIQDLVQVYEDQGGVPTFGLPPPPNYNSLNSSAPAPSTSSNSTSNSSATNQSEKLIADFLHALYSNNGQNDSPNPVHISLNTFQSSLSMTIG